jgi:hypothetical protein
MSKKRLRDEIRSVIGDSHDLDEPAFPVERIPCLLKDELRKALRESSPNSVVFWLCTYIAKFHLMPTSADLQAYIDARPSGVSVQVPARLEEVLSAQGRLPLLGKRYLESVGCKQSNDEWIRQIRRHL